MVADLDNVYAGVKVLLEDVSHAIASRGFPLWLTGEPNLLKALQAIRTEFRSKIAASTLGCEGAIAWDGESFHYCPAFKVETVDTTGAGDIFHGAFVYGMIAGMGLPEQLEFSCAAAALNCTGFGARGRIGSLAEIRELMKKGARHNSAYPAKTFKG